jgi:uncharacterized protein YjbI with pentapeptide repeats
LLEREEAMANQEQLSILKQGVEAWNKWREENPDTHVDLSSAELNWNPHWEPVIPNMDITEATSFSDGHPVSSAFRGINFKNADLSKAKLTYCDLREAILTSAGLEGANLSGAHLTGADLSQARFLETDVSGANLDNAHLCNAILYDTNLSESSLIEADLRDMHALKCEFMELI